MDRPARLVAAKLARRWCGAHSSDMAETRRLSPSAAAPKKSAHACVICGFEPEASVSLVAVSIAGKTRRACAFHALVADRTAPKTLAEFRRACVASDRRGKERRHGEDRRAFWRPTPDRRAESRELGRRHEDAIVG
jgi:hypothetical protein